MAQGIQLAGIDDGGLAHRIAMRIVEFRGPSDASGAFDNRIDLALIAAAKLEADFILSGHDASRREVEALDFAGPVHADHHSAQPAMRQLFSYMYCFC